MRLKSTTIVGEETNVKKHMYAENYRDADDYKEASEGLFCIDYPVNRSFYLMGTDFGSLGGNTEAMQEYTKVFSKCFEDYFEEVKKNPTILTKEDFYNYINTNFKEFDEAKEEWENICNDSVDILVEYFNELLLEVAPIEMVTKKCNFNFLLYNPITFYDLLYEVCEENDIPVSVVVMNDLWDENDNSASLGFMHMIAVYNSKQRNETQEKINKIL